MRKIINGIIVVEGKSDVAFLSQFLNAEFVVTNGSAIPEETIEYLKKSSGNRDVFVLTDPDSPGKKIRDTLDTVIPNLKHCFVSKENSIKNGKVGVAESTKEEVLLALDKYIQSKQNSIGSIKHSDLVLLGLEGSEGSTSKRNLVIDKLHLGHCNAKTFLKRLNYTGITIEELKNIL